MAKNAASNSIWCQIMKNSTSFIRFLAKLMVYLIIFSIVTYVVYSMKLVHPSYNIRMIQTPLHLVESIKSSFGAPVIDHLIRQNQSNPVLKTSETPPKTQLSHIVFGIAASANLWEHRKNYIKLWWRPDEMRGFVWLDKTVSGGSDEDSTLPPLKISSDISKFPYTNKKGDRSAIRLSRIVSETVRLGLKDVKWIVMGDDDTFFVADNLVRVLSKYDNNQFYYIGSTSESHLQNVRFSYNMAYGGGGFAISYPLAVALEKMQDRCIQRYPELYGSDDRIQACMAELGVPPHKGDRISPVRLVWQRLWPAGSASRCTPSLTAPSGRDSTNPLPYVNQVQALKRLTVPMKLDSAGLIQQSICYDKARNWTVSVSWGYAVQIIRGILSPREMERPARTFLNWYRKVDEFAFSFNTRRLNKNACQRPFVYTLSGAVYNARTNQTVSEYVHYPNPDYKCEWKTANPSHIRRVEVFKKPDPFLWDKPPRRNCCRVLPSEEDTMEIEVGECREGEIIEF